MSHESGIRVERLLELQRSRGLSTAELARATNRKYQQVVQWFNRERTIGEKLARSLEEALHLPRGWLDEPVDRAASQLELLSKYTALNFAESAGRPEAKVPLVRWPLLMQMPHLDQPTTKNVPWVHTTVPCSERALYVAMPDDSMEPQIHRGDGLLFDPDVAPFAGAIVLVRRASTGTYFVRVFHQGDDTWRAVAANPHFDPLHSTDGIQVMAVMVERRTFPLSRRSG